jgi:hypothetical protein
MTSLRIAREVSVSLDKSPSRTTNLCLAREVWPRLAAQGAAALRMRKNSERKRQAPEEKEDGKEKSQTSARRTALKGQTRHLTFDVRPAVSAGLSPTCSRALAKQPPAREMPWCPRNMDLQRLRAVMMERSSPSRRPRSPRP